MPARRVDLGGEALVARQLLDDSRRLVRLVLCVRVEEQSRAVAGDDHLPPETLPRLVVEVERPQALAERIAVLLVVQLHLDAPVLVGHWAMICAAHRGAPRAGRDTSAGPQASRTIVTGPSLTSSTSIRAPKRPVSTPTPRSRRDSTKRATSASATAGGAARVKLGRLPFRVSARSVN